MKKYIVLSTNWNPDYLYYLPLTVWAWRKFGWETIVFFNGDSELSFVKLAYNSYPFSHNSWNELSDIPGYRSDTITQISRLYGACIADGYLMTGDIDMIPLSDYWIPQTYDDITIWGHDLTGYTHYPICYIGMPATRWTEVMGLTSSDYNKLIERDLDMMPDAKNSDFYKYWFTDQELITQRIKETQFEKYFIPRGQLHNGYAKGRVDRGAWSLEHEQFIDCHMLRDMYKSTDTGAMNFAKTMRLLDRIWPDEDFTWFKEYTKEFQKLANNG